MAELFVEPLAAGLAKSTAEFRVGGKFAQRSGHRIDRFWWQLTCGAFTPTGAFVELPDLDRLEAAWREAVFALYLAPFSLGRGQDRTGSGREDVQLGAQRPEC